MNKVYCSECGTPMTITRKGLPKYGRVIDIVPPHICHGEPLEIDFEIVNAPSYVEEPKGKFVRKLDELQPKPSSFGGLDTNNLLDRRDISEVKSTAPRSILKGINIMNPSIPTHDIEEEPENE
jgi:hypothetical protein